MSSAGTASRHRLADVVVYRFGSPPPPVFSISVSVPLPTEATTNREELMSYFKLMYTMRRMEITCDTEYKVRLASRRSLLDCRAQASLR